MLAIFSVDYRVQTRQNSSYSTAELYVMSDKEFQAVEVLACKRKSERRVTLRHFILLCC